MKTFKVQRFKPSGKYYDEIEVKLLPPVSRIIDMEATSEDTVKLDAPCLTDRILASLWYYHKYSGHQLNPTFLMYVSGEGLPNGFPMIFHDFYQTQLYKWEWLHEAERFFTKYYGDTAPKA